MTMCPIARLADGRYILFFTNNDGSARNAAHVWDGDGHTRNPQWFAIAREIPGESRNGGLLFGTPRLLVDVDDTIDPNLKTGLSMPQFFQDSGRHFVCYNANKEHLFLDELPASVLDEMTPPTPAYSSPGPPQPTRSPARTSPCWGHTMSSSAVVAPPAAPPPSPPPDMAHASC
jgi:hypothetical protein